MATLPGGNETESGRTTTTILCYAPTMITTNGVWQGVNPLDFALPLFILQVILVVITTRTFVFLLKPFHQPRVIAETISGIVLGPSVFGKIRGFGAEMFPKRSLLILETVAHIGLVYFLFLVGVEMDASVIRRTGRKAFFIAIGGMILPFGIGSCSSFLLRGLISTNIRQGVFLLFISVALSITAFPVLARILAETKLLNSELGRVAMSSAMINDMCAWILLALSISLTTNPSSYYVSLWVLLSATLFVLACFYIVRPIMWWVLRRIPEGESIDDFTIYCILTGVMMASLISDSIGVHSVFGAFIFGLVIPNGPLGVILIEKLEDFVAGLLLPLFFVISGLKTNVTIMNEPITVLLLALVCLLASLGKIASTVMIALFYSMPTGEGIALGFLMNTKGLLEVIVLNIGHDKAVLDDTAFSVMVLSSLIMTSLVTPMVTFSTKPSRRLVGYKRRNLQKWMKPDSELRMLVCVHHTRNVPTIISLLEASNPSKKSPIFAYALHLVELAGRASTMVVVHNAASGGGHAQAEQIFSAFETYEQHAAGVSVRTLTAVSPYHTMHEDVCNLAEDKHVSLIILPFHKLLTVDGAMEPTNPSIRTVNENVLTAAACSVGILVDRGFSAATRIAGQHQSHHVAVLFFGGPDDREALAYAWRMSERPENTVTVVRFQQPRRGAPPSPPAVATAAPDARDTRVITIVTDVMNREHHLDEEYLSEFQAAHANNESVKFMEKMVSNSEETVAAIQAMESIYDLYVVGRGQRVASPLTAGLTEFSECPELGAIGDLLASSDFAAKVSVLVMQQFVLPELENPAQAEPQILGNNRRGRVLAGTHRAKASTPNPSVPFHC